MEALFLFPGPCHSTSHRLDASSQVAKWVIKLSKFDVWFQPKPYDKVQVIMEFILECTIPEEPIEFDLKKEESTEPNQKKEELEKLRTMCVDRSFNSIISGSRLVLASLKGVVIKHS